MPVHLRFGRATKHKSPRELPARVDAALQQLRETKSDRVREKAMEDVSRNVEHIKVAQLQLTAARNPSCDSRWCFWASTIKLPTKNTP